MNVFFLVIGGALALTSALGALLFFQPKWILKHLEARMPGTIYYVKTAEPILALTIDDGPDPVATPELLEVLARHNAQATFFLFSDQVDGNEELVRRIVREGHEIGNHLLDDNPSIQLSAEAFERALLDSHTVLSRFADVHWFRPGSGWHNGPMLATLEKHQYGCALGSVYPYDSHLPFPWFSRLHLSLNVFPGAIVVLHDGGARGRRTAAVLETTLPDLQRRGYQITTLSQLIKRSAEPS